MEKNSSNDFKLGMVGCYLKKNLDRGVSMNNEVHLHSCIEGGSTQWKWEGVNWSVSVLGCLTQITRVKTLFL